MSGSVGIVSSATGSVIPTPPPHVVVTPSQAASSVPASFNNPRIIQDPSAGYITQYLSANGSQVLSQTPNAITVAYLRNGLSADGTPKHKSTDA